MIAITGGCQCKRVRFVAHDAPVAVELCHCSMCRRAVGNIFMASVSVLRTDVAWEGEAATYASSAIATRGFCATCGTPLWFGYDDSARIDLMAGAIDQAAALQPGSHFGVEARLEAFRDLDGLPEARTEDDARIMARWAAPR